jgi:hypothetical protein
MTYTPTNYNRINDNEKLQEKVTEALNVFTEYIKTQKNDGTGPQETAMSGPGAPKAEAENVKI